MKRIVLRCCFPVCFNAEVRCFPEEVKSALENTEPAIHFPSLHFLNALSDQSTSVSDDLGSTVGAKMCEQQQSQHPPLEQVPCELTPWTLGYFPKVSKPLVQVKGMFFHVRVTDPHRNITRMGYMSIKQQLFFLLKEANIMQNRKLYSINRTKTFLMCYF